MRLRALVTVGVVVSSIAASGEAAEVPFRWTPGQIEIQVSIDRSPPLWCILDSGAEFSMLDTETAEAMKLGPARRRDGREQIDDVTLAIGPITLRAQSLTLWRLDNFRRQNRAIRCVIGCELFERYVVTVDYQKQRLLLREPPAFRPDPAATSFPITFDGRLPVLRTSMRFGSRTLPVRLMVDTGASQAAVLRYPFASQHRLLEGPVDTTTSETTASGRRAFVTIPVEELTIGQWTFRKPGVKVYGSAAGAGGYTSTDGLLGNDVLRHFRVTFDYSRKRILLEKMQDVR
jgi:Aspartyl protease